MVRNANGGRGVAFHVGELLLQRLRVEETCENVAEEKAQGRGKRKNMTYSWDLSVRTLPQAVGFGRGR